MHTRLFALLVVTVSTLSLQAADAPEWLDDLRAVGARLGVKGVAIGSTSVIEIIEIKAIASIPKTPGELDAALVVLPTPERRDRAYKTLISYTRWQPQPGFTADGAHGGHPHAMEHTK